MFSFQKLSAYVKKRGFSLPETLITMSIIGVVFSLTAGVMIADYQRNYTGIRLKQMYALIEQAFRGASAFHSNPNVWNFPETTTPQGSYDFFSKYMKPYLQLSLDCKNSSNDSCDFSFKQLDSSDEKLGSEWTRFFLNDGTFIAIEAYGGVEYKLVYFFVDVNGKKRLNVVGRDIFMFEYWIENPEHPEWVGKLLPYGHEKTREQIISGDSNSCGKGGNGRYCASLIIRDNWQIKQGYPWSLAKYALSMDESFNH